MAIIKFQNSSSFKLASFFTFLLATSVAVVAYLIFLAHDEDLQREVELEINADIQILSDLEQLGGLAAMEKIIAERVRKNQDKYFYSFSNKKISNIDWPKDAIMLEEGLIKFAYKKHHVLAKIHTLASGDRLLIGRNIAAIETTQNMITKLGFAIIFAMAIVVLVGYLVGKYVVNLINTISSTAEDIMRSGDLSRRIPITHQRDDLSKLAHVLNSMFDKIEHLLAGVRQVSDNIAHDLRTPLARLRNNLEGFSGSEEEKEKLIKEADNLISIFNALLRIARVEQYRDIKRFSKISLHSLLADVVELYEPLAEQKKQKIAVKLKPIALSGDRDLLFQMLANLLDNAIKFTPKKGEISISIAKKRKFAQIKIADSGVGIPEADKTKVFDRFYRVEACRSTAGHGLGLSLVAAIANIHDAELKLYNNKPTGLIVEINIPL